MSGKLLGGLFGLMVAGLVGAFFGVVIGHFFDLGRQANGSHGPFRIHFAQATQIQKIFFDATFSVMGHIAKADGRISKTEIQMARQIMDRLQLQGERRQRAIQLFTRGKQNNFNLEQTIIGLRQVCGRQPLLIRMFVEIQYQAAMAEGTIQPTQQRILNHLSNLLGLHQQQHDQYSGSSPSRGNDLSAAYKALGVQPSASDADIKRTYRKLMSENHPDKLVSKGLPESMLKLATEKTKNIQKAYDTICKARTQ